MGAQRVGRTSRGTGRRRGTGRLRGTAPLTLLFGLGWLASGCSSAASSTSTSTSSSTHPSSSTTSTGAPAPAYARTPTAAGPIDPTAIPLGDGYVSTTPKMGYVDSCQTSFPATGGAQTDGPWIDTATHSWNSETKVHVQGAVSWPTARYSVTVSGGSRVVTADDLPVDHTTGVFPIAATDPAYAYDRNPNTIVAQTIDWTLPEDPVAAATPTCTSGGAVGILDDGVLLFNALDGEGRDAGAHEVLDACDEHPMSAGELHHHSVPSCILARATGSSTLVGYAIDGYGIYVERDAHGALLTNTDLDACHGRTSPVLWNGTVQDVYHYDATLEYPYTIGCFHGTPIGTASATTGAGGGGGAGAGGAGGGPAGTRRGSALVVPAAEPGVGQ